MTCQADGGALVVAGPQIPQACDFDVPGDVSSAAFLLAAAAVIPGARAVVDDVGLNPTRTAFLDVLRRFGARRRRDADQLRGGTARARRGARRVAAAQSSIEPDEVPGLIDELPLVGVLGAFARGTTVVTGAAELRVKESDRIETFARAARTIGVEVETFDDGFAVHGPARFRERLGGHGGRSPHRDGVLGRGARRRNRSTAGRPGLHGGIVPGICRRVGARRVTAMERVAWMR